ncbi:MAG: tryptophan--tRNA ligase [Patescibacteria group bacterium]
MKPVLVSGIQPSGRLHIGNYLGALKNFVELQNSGKYNCYFFIADLHSLTENYNPKEKPGQILELTADFLASGLDPKKSTIFLQSSIPAHSELAWILNTITPIGELKRMTQFKDKSGVTKKIERLEKEVADLRSSFKYGSTNTFAQTEIPKKEREIQLLSDAITVDVNVGLFTYPTLMAADILLYDAKYVPVGDDQLQHLELTRTLARKFNARFGKTFVESQPILTKIPRVMSLINPTRKMSKSEPEGCLFVDDSPEEIKRKIARATTDSGSEIKHDEKKKPGISNLLEIYSALSGKTTKELEKKFTGKNYAAFKKELATLTSNFFADFRKNKKSLLAKHQTLITTLKSGSEKASAIADKKILEVKKKIGLAI